MDKINLSDGEWKLMNLLWQNPPKTITKGAGGTDRMET